MNILGLVFPASLFQQTDHQTSLERNGLRTKCPIDGTFRPLENRTREASQSIRCREHSSDYGYSEKSSGDLDDCSRKLVVVGKISGAPLNLSHDEPAKRTSRKKKKKKGKSNKLHLDSNIALETVHISKISLSTGLAECNLNNTAVRNETAKEVIGRSVHDKVVAKVDGISSELTLNSEGSKHFWNTADTEPLTSISKLSSKITAFQDPASGNKNIEGTCNTKFSMNQENTVEAGQGSSIITSITYLESMGVRLEAARDNDTKPAPGNDNCSTVTCERGSDKVSFRKERSGTQNEVTANTNFCITGSNVEPCSRSLLAASRACCPANLHISLGVNEANKYESWTDVKSSNQCSRISDIPLQIQCSLGLIEADRKDNNMEVTSNNKCTEVCDAPAVEPIPTSKLNKGNSQISNSTARLPFHSKYGGKYGKENAYFTWQRTGRYIGSSQTVGRKIADQSHPCMDAASSETTSLSKHGSSKGDGLLPPPHSSHYGKDGFQQKVKYSGVNNERMYETRGRILADASEWATTQGNFHARHGQYVSRPRKDEVVGSSSWERSQNKLILPSKQESANNGRKGSWVSKPNLCKPGTGKAFLHEIKTNDEARTTSIEGVKPSSVHVSLSEEEKSSVSSVTELPSDSTTKVFFTSRVSSHVWIPVGKKHSSMLNTSIDIDHNDIRKINHRQTVDNDGSCGASSGLDITKDVHTNCLTNNRQGNLGKEKDDYCSASDYASKNLPIYICSDRAEQALKASYTSQIASESFQLATGSPIAEFEKLLYSASPVIAPSSFQQCHVVKHEPVSASFIKFPKPSIALRDVWNWYEGPGNYGLQIKAKNPQLEADVSFYAHFVPFLSAIQLFGRPYHSVGSSFGNTGSPMPEREDTEEHRCPSSSVHISSLELGADTSSSDPVGLKKQVRSCGVATSDGSGCSASASSVCPSDDSHVIFEYFEHEPPQQRRPFFAK